MKNARERAVNILISVIENGAYSNITVKNELSGGDMSREDKALTSKLVYGVLDRKITLDYIISKYVRTKPEKIKPITLNALRIALYQLIYMDKIPDSAAVNESVKIVKNSKERFNASFVNGVLRSYLRSPAKLPDPADAQSLSIVYSCPIWIVESFIEDYGFETAVKLLEASLEKPPVCLRVNTLKTDAESLISELEKEGIRAEKCDIKNALIVSGSIDIATTKAYNEGLFHVQDLASQKMIEQIPLASNMRVLDICSAPGGKSFTMAQYLGNIGEIVSCDLYEHKIDLIKNGAKRLGIAIIKPTLNNAEVKNSQLGKFDVVLCDVPCSGLGVIRRKPEIKYKKISDKEYAELLKRQKNILETAVSYLKDDGYLIYSTCTLKTAENRAQITAFLDKYNDYDVKYSVEYMPHIDKTDGFFSTIMCKKR